VPNGAGFATGVAVLLDETLSPLDGTEPEVGPQPPDEPGVEREAHSRVEPLLVVEACSPDGVWLPEARPADEAYFRVEPLRWHVVCSPGAALTSEERPGHAVHSQVEAWPPGRSVDEACFQAEPRSLPDEPYWPSPKRSAGEARYCVLPECCLPQRWVEDCCFLGAQPTAWPLTELRHSWLQVCKVRLLVWPVRRH